MAGLRAQTPFPESITVHGGSRVLEVKSAADARAVRAEAATALRLGQIPSGETSF